jgi:hypothetical protein
MKKIEKLRNSISNQKTNQAIGLCDELYDNLRDFSQCIDIVEADGKISIHFNKYTTPERTKKLKSIIQEWVGGH